MKKGYWISLYLKVENQENLKKYAEAVTLIIKRFWRSVPLVRGGNHMKLLMGIILLEQLFGNFQAMKKL